MRYFLLVLTLFLNLNRAEAQVQQFPFPSQTAYNGWGSVSSMAPVSFSYDSPAQAVNYSVGSWDPEYLVSTQLISSPLAFPVEGEFRITFKVRKLLSNSYNTYFPLLLTSSILPGPDEHPWRKGPSIPYSLGDFQSVPLLGVLFTHNMIGLVHRQNNTSFATINYFGNFELPSNTDLWIELIRTCSTGFQLSVYDTQTMDTAPLASEQYNLPSILVPLNALYIANCNGNGEWTEHNDLLDDYTIESLATTAIAFDYSIVPSSCTTPGIFHLDTISGGVPPYTVSFNGAISSSNTYEYDGDGTLSVQITDSEGCSRSTGINLVTNGGKTTLTFPNVLTPNKDDINDEWFVKGDCIQQFSCSILDRWGNEIVVLSNINQRWDGTQNGKNCVDGVYFYASTVEFTSGKNTSYHGFITLIR